MVCSSTWITAGSTKTISGIKVKLNNVYNDCQSIGYTIYLPWGENVYSALHLNTRLENTHYNPLDLSEFVIVKYIDTWCPDPTHHGAEIEVCYELPPECPIPICDFIIS